MPRTSRTRPGAPVGWTTDDWATPPALVEGWAREFGRPFDLDPCAADATAKADLYYTKEENGLAQPWSRGGGHIFVNPPYSDPEPWIRKAIAEWLEHDAVTRLLLPNCTDTSWFHDLVLPHGSVRFIRGRIGFLGYLGTPIGSPRSGSILVSIGAPDPQAQIQTRPPRRFHRSAGR